MQGLSPAQLPPWLFQRLQGVKLVPKREIAKDVNLPSQLTTIAFAIIMETTPISELPVLLVRTSTVVSSSQHPFFVGYSRSAGSPPRLPGTTEDSHLS